MALTDNYKPLLYAGGTDVLNYPITWNVVETDTIVCSLYKEDFLIRTLQYNIDYTFEHATEPGVGGTVTLVEKIPQGFDLVIERLAPYTQWLELLNSGRLDLVALEKCLDHIVMLIQQVRDYSIRSVRVPPSSDITPEDFVQELYTGAERAEASAAAAAESASNAAQSEASASDNALLTEEYKNVAQSSAESSANSAEEAKQYTIQAGLDAPKIVQMVTDEGAKQVGLVEAKGALEVSEVEAEGTRQVNLVKEAVYVSSVPSYVPDYTRATYLKNEQGVYNYSSPPFTENGFIVLRGHRLASCTALVVVPVEELFSAIGIINMVSAQSEGESVSAFFPVSVGEKIQVNAEGAIAGAYYAIEFLPAKKIDITENDPASVGLVQASIAALEAQIPTVPTTLPNPHALTINGTAYDGSKAVEVSIKGGGHGGVDYSTLEQDTGLTWVDGKTVYQKTITVSDWDGTSSINHGITGFTTLISATATVRTGV